MKIPADIDKYPIKAIDSPLARELSEYQLLQVDLRTAMLAIKLWHEKYPLSAMQTQEEITIRSCLFRDAIIQFMACFDPKAEFFLPKQAVYKDRKDDLAYFKWLLDLRDAFAAHRFGSERQCVICVAVLPDNVRVLRHLYLHYAGPAGGGTKLLAFMKVADKYLHERIANLAPKVLDELSTKTDAELNALPDAELYDLRSHEYRVSRNRLHRSRAGQGPKVKRPG